jgi:hypothetical protein
MATIQQYTDELDYVIVKLGVAEGSFSFMEAMCNACLRADGENYELLRPALHALMQKYPAPELLLEAERSDNGAGA